MTATRGEVHKASRPTGITGDKASMAAARRGYDELSSIEADMNVMTWTMCSAPA